MLSLPIRKQEKSCKSQTMAACGSLEHIFERPLPEAPTFLESLSPWKHVQSMKTIDDSSFTEIFGELHFKENHHVHSSPESSSSSSSSESSPSSSSSSNSTDPNPSNIGNNGVSSHKNSNCASSFYPSSQRKQYGHTDSFSSMNSESLSLCTEGLGFESFDDVEDLLQHDLCKWEHQGAGKSLARNSQTENQKNESKISSRTNKGEFPPPISCIGRSGKPWVCFKSYREDGRFILKEIRIPTQEFLHACRENGRLKLRFIQSDDEILEQDQDQDQDEDDEENEDDMEELNHEENQDQGRNAREMKNEEKIVESRHCNFSS